MFEPPEKDELHVVPGGYCVSVEAEPCLADLPVGARLLIRSRLDWRFATIARVGEEKITLTVCSPTGRTYRLRRPPDFPLYLHGEIPIAGIRGSWQTGLARYDLRW